VFLVQMPVSAELLHFIQETSVKLGNVCKTALTQAN